MVQDAPEEQGLTSMENWSDALRITAVGLGVVFGVMALIALATWASGRVFVSLEKREKARKHAAETARAAQEAEPPKGAG